MMPSHPEAHIMNTPPATAGHATRSSSPMLDLANPQDTLQALRKLHASATDGKPVVFHWSGHAWARREGEPDRLLFRVEGMNIRQAGTLQDPERGQGFRLVSRELMLYLDPTSGEPLRTWRNPWTDQDVDVMHVANDPVNQRPFFERDPQGRPLRIPFRVQGERVFAPAEIPLFYPNPLGGEYQDYVGNHYHAMEIFDFVADRHALFSRYTDTANAALAWVRIAPWLPFMRMGSRPGLMVFNAMGQAVDGIDALPDVLRQAIQDHYPQYDAPPPLDDMRPNATSWTVARQAIDTARKP